MWILCDGFSLMAFALAAVPAMAGWISPEPLQPGRFGRIVAFADSFNDVGNYRRSPSASFPLTGYYGHRFCNGPVWIEYLAEFLGVPVPTASSAGGPNATNYAYSGAQVVGRNSMDVPSLQEQVAEFLAKDSPRPTDLLVLRGGTNDFAWGQTDPGIPAKAIKELIVSLASRGAKSILVVNLEPLGSTPWGTPNAQRLNTLCSRYNALVASHLADLRIQLGPNVFLYEFDTYGLVGQILANPGNYGLTNVTQNARISDDSPPVLRGDPDEYCYWDTLHYTRASQRLQAEAVVSETVWGHAVIRVVTTGDDANDGSSWTAAKHTVQAALDAARPGDQVWVAADTYVGCITLKTYVSLYGGFAGNETELTQRNWTANATILDGNQTGSVVTSPPGATPTTRIDGFTIRNGSGTLRSGVTAGGGIFCSYGSPTITNNTITANSATYYGGGVYCDSSSPTITNNLVAGNTAGRSGGGIYCSATFGVFANNIFRANTASASYSGGGMYNASGNPTLANCSFSGNSAGSGGALGNASGSPVLVNCTFAANSGTSGSAISRTSGTPVLTNCIVWGNSSSPQISGSLAITYSCVQGGWTGQGNINLDPLFASAASGDYHLGAGSLCIDSGNNAGVPIDVTSDLAGRPRFFDDPAAPDTGAGTPPIVDMGAYEFAPVVPADLDGDGDVGLDDLGIFEACASGPAISHNGNRTCQTADFDHDGDVDQLDFGMFQRCYSGAGEQADPNCVD